MEGKQTEEIILEAAEKLFLEQGFKETTTAQIAKAAGCNSALVHYYYRTKENLFAKIFSSKVGEYTQNLFAELDEKDSLEDLIRYAIETHWNFMTKNASLTLFIMKEILSQSDRTIFFIERHEEMRKQTVQKMDQLRERECVQGKNYAITSEELLTLILALDTSYFYPIVIKAKALGEQIDDDLVFRQREEVIKTVMARLHYEE